MKRIAEHLYARGKAGNLYCHLRIPSKLEAAYPRGKTHITNALHTTDVGEGKRLLITELACVYDEFARKEKELAVKAAQRAQRSARRLTALTDAQLNAMAGNWVHQSLLTDDLVRSKGLDDDEFDSLDVQLQQQRKELGRLLAQGKVEPILPAMRSFIHLLGTEVDLSPEQERQAAYKFLESVVQALDVRLERQAGRVKPSADLAPSMRVPELQKSLASGKGPTWAEVFEKWVKHVHDRAKETVIAAQTPWRELERVARAAGIKSPGLVTKHLVNQFVEDMIERGLATDTINDRLRKVKAIYRVAVGKLLLEANPAQDIVGRGKSAREKRQKKRLPFDQSDLNNIFSCAIYNGEHKRSRGRSKEASYWIPLFMYYTGARTEEVAVKSPRKPEPLGSREFPQTESLHEEIQIQRSADSRHPQGGRVGCEGRRDVQEARRERADVLQVEEPVLGHDGVAPGTASPVAGRERQAQAHVCRPGADAPRAQGRC